MADKYSEPFVEFRGDFLREHMDIIDAVAQATPGANRASVVRSIVAAWCDQKITEATLIERVRRGNGNGVAGTGQPSGSSTARGR